MIKQLLCQLFNLEPKESCEESIDLAKADNKVTELRLKDVEKELSECRRQKQNILDDYNVDKERLMVAEQELWAMKNKPIEPEDLPKVEFKVTWTLAKVQEVLLNVGLRNVPTYLSDDDYGLLTEDQLKKFLLDDKVNLKKYVAKKYDCENFSLSSWDNVCRWAGNVAYGMLWIKKPTYHSINICILADGRVMCVEPQTDKLYPIPKDYVPTMVII